MKTRERILGTIRTALSTTGRAEAPEPREVGGRIGPQGRLQASVDGFVTRCEQTQATIHHVGDIHQACQSIRTLIQEKDVARAVVWDHPLTRSVMQALDKEHNVEWLVWNPSRFEDQRSDDRGKNRLSAMDLGLTAADFALADSGSLVLVAGEGRDPLVSMLPPIHVALLGENQIVEGIDLFLERISGGEWPESGSFNLISGPSRTGDIELTMSLGVHGPKEVHVVLGKNFS